jgi:SAM-dependent methyltransferase
MAERASGPRPYEGRFEEFFVRDSYVTLKNYLYNYLERKRALNKRLARQPRGRVLEVGCGLSPIVTGRDDVIYSEVSLRAIRALKAVHARGLYVVADGTQLPFRSDTLDQVICSEVLEHIADDEAALRELARVARRGGSVYITVPHRQAYFAADDAYVGHLRRYEVPDMERKLERAGLHVVYVRPVLGPLEKLTMWTLVVSLSAVERAMGRRTQPSRTPSVTSAAVRAVLRPVMKWAHRAYALLARLDAAVAPPSLAAVMLFEGVKSDGVNSEGRGLDHDHREVRCAAGAHRGDS